MFSDSLTSPEFAYAECKVDSAIATKARGKATAFSMAMALRRLHWRNTMLAEVLYTVNLYKVVRGFVLLFGLVADPSHFTLRGDMTNCMPAMRPSFGFRPSIRIRLSPFHCDVSHVCMWGQARLGIHVRPHQ